MKLITRNTDYAIRALILLAKERTKKRMSVTELGKKLKIPRPFLRKILQLLQKDGTLKSYKGPNGGFILNASPEALRLINVIEVFQGPVKLNECLFKKKICNDIAACLLKGKIDEIERRVITELKAITLASLL